MSRRRILDSAQKVLELYGGSRMILELEFFGEVGTGLGPTLEFYTLLAHELQVCDGVTWCAASLHHDTDMTLHSHARAFNVTSWRLA